MSGLRLATLGLAAWLLFVLLAWQFRRRTGVGMWVLAAMLLGGACLTWLGSKLAAKAYHASVRVVASTRRRLAPRTSQEIYSALFGRPTVGCVRVLRQQDQVVPKIDYAIWLHYQTCPTELKRILARHAFTRAVVATNDGLAAVPHGEVLNWFRPAAIGDTVIVYEYATPNGRTSQTLWVSPDSTQVFCRDIAD